MRALMVVGENRYGVVSSFVNGLADALKQKSIDVSLLSVENDTCVADSVLALESGIDFDFVVSFNGLGLDLQVSGQRDYLKHVGKPIYVLLVDHPLHLFSRFYGANVTVLCVDQEHAAFCQLCGIDALYFPHAADENWLAEPVTGFEDKTDEIIFPASHFSLMHWRKKLEPVWSQVGEMIDGTQSITRFMQAIGILPIGEHAATTPLDENLKTVCMFVDFYQRAKKRREALHHAEEKGVRLTVVGADASRYKEVSDFHHYEDAMPFSDLCLRIKHARYGFHNSPGFERGLHERLMMPLALGTLTIIDDVPFAQHAIHPALQYLNLASFSPLDGDSYVNIQHILRAEIAQNHTWNNRADTLLAHVNSKTA
ncbi:hypothetical protein OE749_12300 [Aestuariibacter sp. AA17]|uniref:Glycosyl transferase family 1 n=1 Tax=Fluctibacter corallii TaxID=2984329 RepID=A0ABT3A9W7_9ALTE|nr:hypothetical protein [Aestuariibacter sp. AA17]MCV2885477.1 hypothetical protein [Aestuariibacter sp. AA17]